MNLDSILHDNVETLETVNSWYQKLYRDKFQKYFENQKELYKRMQSKSRSITDTELETILIDIPLDLFSVAEMLNTLKLQTEVLKLSIKPKIKELSQNSKESTQTKRDQDAEMQVIGDRILIKVYESVINQVESEITFSKELIMSAKKLWDARRRTEESNPVSPVPPSEDIPEYEIDNAKSNIYIK